MKTEDRRVCPSCGNEFPGAAESLSGVHAARGTSQRRRRVRRVSFGASDQRRDRTRPRGTTDFEHYELTTRRRRETSRAGSRCDGRHLQGI